MVYPMFKEHLRKKKQQPLNSHMIRIFFHGLWISMGPKAVGMLIPSSGKSEVVIPALLFHGPCLSTVYGDS